MNQKNDRCNQNADIEPALRNADQRKIGFPDLKNIADGLLAGLFAYGCALPPSNLHHTKRLQHLDCFAYTGFTDIQIFRQFGFRRQKVAGINFPIEQGFLDPLDDKSDQSPRGTGVVSKLADF